MISTEFQSKTSLLKTKGMKASRNLARGALGGTEFASSSVFERGERKFMKNFHSINYIREYFHKQTAAMKISSSSRIEGSPIDDQREIAWKAGHFSLLQKSSFISSREPSLGTIDHKVVRRNLSRMMALDTPLSSTESLGSPSNQNDKV